MGTHEESVGVRELKAHLSRHLKRVQAGTRLVVTDRGRAVATLGPTDAARPSDDEPMARHLVAEGKASWGGGKPRGAAGVALAGGPSLADTVLEDRR
jgi:prevent-host-death family protein